MPGTLLHAATGLHRRLALWRAWGLPSCALAALVLVASQVVLAQAPPAPMKAVPDSMVAQPAQRGIPPAAPSSRRDTLASPGGSGAAAPIQGGGAPSAAGAGNVPGSSAPTGSSAGSAPGKPDTAAAPDTLEVSAAGASSDTVSGLKPRILPVRQQAMFAGGMMAFIALVLSSMTNINP